MRSKLFIRFLFFSHLFFAQEDARKIIFLNGEWEFDQMQTAFSPAKYTRKIPVPGLIHLAVPRIAEYDWCDLCDEYGIVLQNEWLYWQNHRWDEQIRQEYTYWLWRDGVRLS